LASLPWTAADTEDDHLLIPDRLGLAQPVERLIPELNRKNIGARCNARAWNDEY